MYYLNRSKVAKCEIELYSKLNIYFDGYIFIGDDVLISFKDDYQEENRQYFETQHFKPKFILFSPTQKKMRFIEDGKV